MALGVRPFEGGPVQTNAYLVGDDAAGTALVVDAPYGVADRVVAAAEDAGLRIELIVITHTHWDHVADAAALVAATGAPLAAHPLAVDGLIHPQGSLSLNLPFTIPPVTPDQLLSDGDEVHLGQHTFRVLHLPGHEPAHIALLSEPDRIFLGGDVLFPNGHGRVDIPGSDQATMNRSLSRLAPLPPDTTVYPGHGAPTTIGAEAWLQRIGVRR
jgi:hydroxyacylglutathione hydrolase